MYFVREKQQNADEGSSADDSGKSRGGDKRTNEAQTKFLRSVETFGLLVNNRTGGFRLTLEETLGYAFGGVQSATVAFEHCRTDDTDTAFDSQLLQRLDAIVNTCAQAAVVLCKCIAAWHGYELTGTPRLDSASVDVCSFDVLLVRAKSGGDPLIQLKAELRFHCRVVDMLLPIVRAISEEDASSSGITAELIETLTCCERELDDRFCFGVALGFADKENNAEQNDNTKVVTLKQFRGDDLLAETSNGGTDFGDAICAIFDQLKTNSFQLDSLDTLKRMEPILMQPYYTERLIEVLPKASEMTDIRILSGLLKLLRGVFMRQQFTEKLKIMQTFFAKNGIASYHGLDDMYVEDVNLLSAKVTDYNEATIHQLAEGFAWPFMVGAKKTLLTLLSMCISNEKCIPTITMILRLLDPVTTLIDTSSNRQLLVLGLEKLAEKFISIPSGGRSADVDEMKMSRFVQLVHSLVKVKLNSGETLATADRRPVIDPNSIVKFFIVPSLVSDIRRTIALRCIVRLFQTNVPIRLTTNVKRTDVWNDVSSSADDTDEVEVAKLLVSVALLLRSEVPLVCRQWAWKVFEVICERMKSKSLLFDAPTTEWICSRMGSDEMKWALKFCISCTIGPVATALKLQLPRCLAEKLNLDASSVDRIRCCPVLPSDTALVASEGCALEKLFEIAVCHVSAANALIEKGGTGFVWCEPAMANERFVTALTAVVETNSGSMDAVRSVVNFASRLFSSFDVCRDFVCVHQLNKASFDGMLLVTPVLFVGDALVVQLRKNAVESASQLLTVYSQLAKENADTIVQKYRETVRGRTKESSTFGGVDTEAIKADAAIKQLFLQACIIANEYNLTAEKLGRKIEAPAKLTLLLSCLTDFSCELARSLTSTILPRHIEDTKTCANIETQTTIKSIDLGETPALDASAGSGESNDGGGKMKVSERSKEVAYFMLKTGGQQPIINGGVNAVADASRAKGDVHTAAFYHQQFPMLNGGAVRPCAPTQAEWRSQSMPPAVQSSSPPSSLTAENALWDQQPRHPLPDLSSGIRGNWRTRPGGPPPLLPPHMAHLGRAPFRYPPMPPFMAQWAAGPRLPPYPPQLRYPGVRRQNFPTRKNFDENMHFLPNGGGGPNALDPFSLMVVGAGTQAGSLLSAAVDTLDEQKKVMLKGRISSSSSHDNSTTTAASGGQSNVDEGAGQKPQGAIGGRGGQFHHRNDGAGGAFGGGGGRRRGGGRNSRNGGGRGGRKPK